MTKLAHRATVNIMAEVTKTQESDMTENNQVTKQEIHILDSVVRVI